MIAQKKTETIGGVDTPVLKVLASNGTRTWVGTEDALNAAIANGEIAPGTVADTYVEGEDSFKYNLDYSTIEIDTGRLWIDGKHIFRKALTGTTPATGNETFAVNVINATININSTVDKVVNIGGYVQYPNSVTGMVNVPTSASQWINVWGRGSSHTTSPNSLGIAVGTGAVNLPYVIVVEYTKP